MPLKGYRERIKQATSYQEASTLLALVHATCPPHYFKRCQKAYAEWQARQPNAENLQQAMKAKRGEKKHGKR